jgi:hypothetical protein
VKRLCIAEILLATLALAGSAPLLAQDGVTDNWQQYLIPDGNTVYDNINGVTWLRDADLAASADSSGAGYEAGSEDQPPRFGLPLCNVASTDPCIWRSGEMSYTTAQEWVKRMNAASYLGHSHWRLPSTPFTDKCPGKGPSGESFGFDCSGGAMASLYYDAFQMQAPNTAIPIPPNVVGPFIDFQPQYYWSQSPGGGLKSNKGDFSFEEGSHGGSTPGDYLYVLPMIKGKIPLKDQAPGTPDASGMDLQVNPDGLTIYDPESDVTWAENANLAQLNTFGLPRCQTPAATTANPCVAYDGSMNYDSAGAFITAMNTANYGLKVSPEVGIENLPVWELPTEQLKCSTYNCSDKHNPMGELFYKQLGFHPGQPVVATPDIAVGPFFHVQPGHYWSCQGLTIQGPCEDDEEPAKNSEFGFSFENGYVGTARVTGVHFVMVYFVGCDLPNSSECVIVKNPGPRNF